jgi:serine/threonine protein kinase
MSDISGVAHLLRRVRDGLLVSVPPTHEFEFGRSLGTGGLGCVYVVKESREQLGRNLAAKVMLYPGDGALRRRFKFEGALLGHVVSPHVVRIHYVVELPFEHLTEDARQKIRDKGCGADTVPVLVMELLQGGTLCRGFDENPFLRTDALRYVSDLLAGVADLHSAGIYHGDIKPLNLLRDHRDRVKIADFGRGWHLPASSGLSLTALAVGPAMVATVAYAAPEEIVAEQEGGPELRSPGVDLYQVAVTAFELLTGRRPYPDPTTEEVRARQREQGRSRDPAVSGELLRERTLRAPIPDPRELVDDLAEPIAEWVVRGLAKDPADRWASAREALETWQAAVEAEELAHERAALIETTRMRDQARANAERELEEVRNRLGEAIAQLSERDTDLAVLRDRVVSLERQVAEATDARAHAERDFVPERDPRLTEQIATLEREVEQAQTDSQELEHATRTGLPVGWALASRKKNRAARRARARKLKTQPAPSNPSGEPRPRTELLDVIDAVKYLEDKRDGGGEPRPRTERLYVFDGCKDAEPVIDAAAHVKTEDLISELTRGRGRREMTLHKREGGSQVVRLVREADGRLVIQSNALWPSQRVLAPGALNVLVLRKLLATALVRLWPSTERHPIVHER